MRNKSFSDKSGSAMIAAIFVAVVIGFWVAATMQSSFTEYKMSTRYLNMQSALNLAESGLEEAVRAHKSGDWTGWTSYSSGYYLEDSVDWLGGDVTGTYKVYIKTSGSAPVIAAEGTVLGADGTSLNRQIKVELASSSLFMNGMLARNEVIFNGNNVLVDSYDSRVGSYTPSSYSNRNSEGSVASTYVQNTAILVNNADIRGYVATGASSWNDSVVGPNGSLHDYSWSSSDSGDADGDGITSGDDIDNSRVTTDFYAELPDVTIPTYSGWTDLGDVGSSINLGNSTDTVAAEYQAERFNLNSSDTLTINGPVKLFVRRNFSMSGNAQIIINSTGSLELYVVESLSISGNGMANNTQKAENVMIYGASPTQGGQSVDLGGNAQLYAVVYAPNANVHMHGGGSGGTMHGAIVGNQISLNGHWDFHYDEALADLDTGDNMVIRSWRELKDVGELLAFDTPSGLGASL